MTTPLSWAVSSMMPEFQIAAESLMTTPCRIVRLGPPVLNPDSGNFEPAEQVIYDGLCKVQTREGEALDIQTGSAAALVQRYQVHVPVSAGPFQDGDLVRVEGRTFRIAGLHSKTWQTAQRLPVEEVV